MAAQGSDYAQRALALGLRAKGGMTTADIAEFIGFSTSTINRIYARAIERGFDPDIRPLVINDDYVKDATKSGRPKKQTGEVALKIISKVQADRYGREKTAAGIAAELEKEGIYISATTVLRILKRLGYKKTKPTRKPGLTKKMREERLKWCLERKDWTLEDWKKVIWSDETSVVLLHRRGGYRIRRKSDEALVKLCIRERWKGSSEFMFWGCFSYDRKGPCHCWAPETAREKKEAEIELEKINTGLEKTMKEKWGMETQMRRMTLRDKKLPGKKPAWRYTKKTGKLTQSSNGGIDWYRYQKLILLPKLLPFAQSCSKKGLIHLFRKIRPQHIVTISNRKSTTFLRSNGCCGVVIRRI